ncbi:hypothetical protein WOJGOHIN_CDS0058 [Staphylococcus phage PG-2021_87]
MKANINLNQGESTKQAVEKAVEKYLAKQDRIVSIKEAYEVLSQTNATVSRMSEQGFEKLATEQIMAHAMKHI